jgi:hypothetical protein
LHALLLAAAAFVGLPWPAKVLAALAALAHALARRPTPVPGTIVVAADGSWRVPDIGQGSFVLGPRTRLTAFWIRIDLRAAAARLDILLLADQLERDDWARLSARLRRAVPPQPGASRDGSGAGGPDLR